LGHLKKIIIIFFVGTIGFLNAQNTLESQHDRAVDSLISNPNYAYALLSKVVKDETISEALKAKTHLSLGKYFNAIGVVDSSMFYTRSALKQLKNEKDIAEGYRVLGSCYRRSGNIDEAMKMLFKSLENAEKIDYEAVICLAKSDLGILYANKGEFEKAIQYFEASNEVTSNSKTISSNYINIGSVYFFKKDLENAEKFFVRGFDLLQKNQAPNASATVALNIGSVLFENKKFKEAALYYDKCKAIADANGFKDKSINATVHKAMCVAALGKSNKAIQLLKNSIAPAKALSSLEIQLNIYENLLELYGKTKQYKAANSALKNYHELKDSISNTRQEKEITELEVKYETSKKEQEILKLEEDQLMKNEEIKRERLFKKMMALGFVIILFPVLALLFVYNQKLKVNRKYNLQKDESNKQQITSFLKEQELKLANTYMLAQNEERSRIARELHDSIGGDLAAIKLQIASINNKHIPEGIVDKLDGTYNQVRHISHNLIPKKIHETEFSRYIEDYIATIEKVAEPKINFIPFPVADIDRISLEKKAEIFKIIQELLTNALKHAKAKVIEICLNAYNDKIEIIFEDNGMGFESSKKPSGIGLQNIKERLNILKAEMDIDSVINRGTAIRIQIPN